MTFAPLVFSVEPGEEIVLGGSFLLVAYRGDHAFFLEPLPGGGTRFRQRERFRGPMVLFMGGMIEATELGYRQMNEAFKRRVEGRRGSARPAQERHDRARSARAERRGDR